MKKIVVLFVSMLVLATTASAGNDKPIQVSQLPQTAQQFIKKYFGDRKVAFAKEESDFRKSYEIAFKNGDKIEFDRKGEWTDIDASTAPFRPESSLHRSPSTSPTTIPTTRSYRSKEIHAAPR